MRSKYWWYRRKPMGPWWICNGRQLKRLWTLYEMNTCEKNSTCPHFIVLQGASILQHHQCAHWQQFEVTEYENTMPGKRPIQSPIQQVTIQALKLQNWVWKYDAWNMANSISYSTSTVRGRWNPYSQAATRDIIPLFVYCRKISWMKFFFLQKKLNILRITLTHVNKMATYPH